MIRFLLDTDIASYLAKRRFPALQQRFQTIPPDEIAISAISYAEILTGLYAVGPAHPSYAATLDFLRTMPILEWPLDAAAPYAKIRQLTRRQPLQERDMLIAAHAIALDVPLVTNNLKHFARLSPPMKIENWLW